MLRYLTLAIFLLLGVRLWWLQVMNHEVYAEQAEQNRIRELPILARRGTIYDRHGKILVTSRSSYNIVLTRPKDNRGFAEALELLAPTPPAGVKEGEDDSQYSPLGISRRWLKKRFEDAKLEPKYESIVVKELASPEDVAWVMAREYDHPELRAEEAPQRLYVYGQFAAHALGYVGEVSPEELKNGPFTREKGYKLGDIVGKSGIERTYDDILTGRDGKRRVIVDSKGRIQQEIERVDPKPGRDLYTTLDYEVQKVAEEQGDTMPAGRGALVAMDPTSGEILAMTSRPAFDPNAFSQRAKTPEGKEEIRELYEDPDRPLYNRVIQGAFAPGSTWKLMTTVAALNEGTITVTNSRIQDGGIQLGDRFVRSMSSLGQPDIHTAIVHSADGYFYRLGLKMGVEKFEKWVDIFRFGQRTGIDLPNERPGTAPTRATKRKWPEAQIKKIEEELAGVTDKAYRSQLEFRIKQWQWEAEWKDVDMAWSAFGQGQNASTPIQLLRYVGGLATGGQMVTPHLLRKADAGYDREGNKHPEVRYEDKHRFTVPMSPVIQEIVKKGMWGVVNEPGGTGGGARIEGFDVCGKTGTAQVVSTEKMGKNTKDNAWFIGFAPRDKPEICSVVLTENAGFGGTHSAPRTKAIYEFYYRRKLGLNETKAEAAKTE